MRRSESGRPPLAAEEDEELGPRLGLHDVRETKDAKQNEVLAASGVFSGNQPNGDMVLDGLMQNQDFFVEQGIQKQKLDPSTFIDRSFVDYAVQQLGRLS